MPQYRCAPCNTRLYSAAGPAYLVDDLCPGCGSRLEPVDELAEDVGFPSTRLDLERWVDEQVAARVGPVLARRAADSAALRLL